MKAAIVAKFGSADTIKIVEIDRPLAGVDEVLIKVKAAGINPVDTKVRAGTSAMSKKIQLPAILGWDVSGVVEDVGSSISSFRKGDEVFGCIGFPGLGRAYAEYTVATPQTLARKPANISFEEAAGVSLAGLTAYQVIHDHLQVRSGQRVLIQAAAGGVGHLAVQFAKQTGAYVSGTASEKNEDFLRSLGVDLFINYKNEQFEERVHNLDAAIDAMGGEILYRTIACVKRGGRVVCLPSSTKDDPKAIDLAKQRDITLLWPMMYLDNEQINKIASLLERGLLKVNIDKVFDINDISDAHKAVESHSTRGKVVVSL